MSVPDSTEHAALSTTEGPSLNSPGASLSATDRIRIIATMYIGYAMFMVLRMAPGVAGTSIVGDESLGIDKGDWGKVLALGTTGAIVGKFIGGLCADRFGGRITFALGLFVSGLGVAAFSFSNDLLMFQASFFIALMAKSVGWPSMTKIIVDSFRPAEYGRVWGVLSTSSRVGTLVATMILGGLLSLLAWRSMLLAAGILGGITALGFYLALRKPVETDKTSDSQLPETTGVPETPEPGPAASAMSHPLNDHSLAAALVYFARSIRFWLIIVSLMALTVMWDFLLMVPLYLKETLNMTDASASMASSAFPFGSLVSVLCGGFVFDRLKRRQTGWLMGLLLLIATGCIGGFLWMPQLNLTEQTAPLFAMTMLFVFGLCVSPCYYIPMSVFSIEFGGPRSGFLVALLDAIAFAGNAVFYFYAGDVAEDSWTQFMWLLIGVSIISAISTFLFLFTDTDQSNASQP